MPDGYSVGQSSSPKDSAEEEEATAVGCSSCIQILVALCCYIQTRINKGLKRECHLRSRSIKDHFLSTRNTEAEYGYRMNKLMFARRTAKAQP